MTKRELKVVPVENSTLYRVVWDGGGELPDMLKSNYTSPAEAKTAIARWKATKTASEEVDLYKKDEEAKRAASATK